MINLTIDSTTGDLNIDKRNLTVATEQEALAQLCETRLMMFKNDYFLDKTQGVPYITQVFVKSTDVALVDSFFKNILLTTPGVNSLISFSGEYDGKLRKYNVSFKVDTAGGAIDGNVKVEVF